MYWKSFFIVIAVVLLQACASNTRYFEESIVYNEVDEKYYDSTENTPLNGIVVELYNSGEIELETRYKNGIRHGVSKRYYKNGMIVIEVPYIKGLVKGNVKIYSEEGILIENVPYKNNYMNGIAKYYSAEGTLVRSISYLKNERNGPFIQYYPNGKDICFSIIYNMGKPSKATLFFDGKIVLEGEELNEWIATDKESCIDVERP